MSEPTNATEFSLDNIWPWAPQGRQFPAMFANDEMLEILMPHGPRLPKGQISFGRLRKRIENTPGAGQGPFAAQLGRLMADPAARAALLEYAGDVEGLGMCMVAMVRSHVFGLDGRPPTVQSHPLSDILEGFKKKAKSGTAREVRKWHVCGVTMTVMMAAVKKDDPCQILREAVLTWPELLPFILPIGMENVTPNLVVGAKAPQMSKAHSQLMLLEARQTELAAVAAELEKAVAEQRALEELDRRQVPVAGRAAARRQQADAWEAWTAAMAALAERAGKVCPAAPGSGDPDPTALLVAIKAARADTAEKLADLHKTTDVAKRLLGLRDRPFHVSNPKVVAAMTDWIRTETTRVVDDTNPDRPVLWFDPEHDRVKDLTILCDLIDNPLFVEIRGLTTADMHVLAMSGAFTDVAGASDEMAERSAELEDAQLENLRLQERVLELEDTIKRKDWELECHRQGVNPEQMKRVERPAPRTVADAVAHAMADFGADLVFLDSAKSSAAASPFQNVGLVYKHLAGMAKLSAMWRIAPDGKLNKGFKEAFLELGLPDYRGQISDTASGKFGQEYLFLYKGEKREFKEHFTLGSKDANTCLSIHFYRDAAQRRLVVGHVGRHLSNTKS